MHLAVVTGSCTATIKDPTLDGRRLAVVRLADETGTAIGQPEVALDVTSATPGQLVLVVRGSSARQPADVRAVATDLTIVGIVDELTTCTTSPPADTVPPGKRTNRRKQSHG